MGSEEKASEHGGKQRFVAWSFLRFNSLVRNTRPSTDRSGISARGAAGRNGLKLTIWNNPLVPVGRVNRWVPCGCDSTDVKQVPFCLRLGCPVAWDKGGTTLDSRGTHTTAVLSSAPLRPEEALRQGDVGYDGCCEEHRIRHGGLANRSATAISIVNLVTSPDPNAFQRSSAVPRQLRLHSHHGGLRGLDQRTLLSHTRKGGGCGQARRPGES